MSAAALGMAAALAALGALGLVAPPSARRRDELRVRGEPPADAPGWVVELCREAGTGLDPVRARSALRATATAAVVASTLAVGVSAGVAVACAAAAVPRLATPVLERRRRSARDLQLPEALERVASSVRAGATVGRALADVAVELPPPLGPELRTALTGLDRGEALTDALARWSSAPGTSGAVSLATSALELGTTAGGQVARAIDGVALSLRERREVQAEIRSLATQARTSAWLLAAAPVAFTAVVAAVEPAAVRFLLTTAPGLLCLVGGSALDLAGLAWMARIVRQAAT